VTHPVQHPVQLGGIHHAAYRCKDAAETVEWYERVLGMNYKTAFAEDNVPSTGEDDPYMHVFLDCGGGNVLAFFELPGQPEMGKDPNTPAWVQHLAFEVEDEAALAAAKAHLEAEGVAVLGPTYHGIFRSIYFFDPNGHRLELACNIGTPDQSAPRAMPPGCTRTPPNAATPNPLPKRGAHAMGAQCVLF